MYCQAWRQRAHSNEAIDDAIKANKKERLDQEEAKYKSMDVSKLQIDAKKWITYYFKLRKAYNILLQWMVSSYKEADLVTKRLAQETLAIFKSKYGL